MRKFEEREGGRKMRTRLTRRQLLQHAALVAGGVAAAGLAMDRRGTAEPHRLQAAFERLLDEKRQNPIEEKPTEAQENAHDDVGDR